MKWPSLIVALLAVVAIGCGGDPSPQDAEAYVEDQYEAQDKAVDVESVYCQEGSGDRYECEVSYSLFGKEQPNDSALVDFAELD